MPWTLLSVEISLALLGLVLLVLGLVLPEKGRRLMQPVAVIGLLGILILGGGLYTAQYNLFGGNYQIDPFAGFFKLLFLVAGILVILSAGRYLERFQERVNEFYSLMIFALLGMVVMASAGEMITLYIGLELMTVSFYILTAYLINDKLSAEAGLKYLILGALSSAILLFGISLVYAVTGTTVIADMAVGFFLEPVMIAGIILILAGFAFKISLVPFHMWAPDIYQGAPIPVTAFLSVGSKAAAFAALVRVFIIAFPVSTFDWPLLLAVLAAITIVVGNLIALAQTDIKRLLAYSSIAQAGYIIVGLAAYNVYGVKGVLFYSMLYVFSNLGAFAAATVVEVETGSTDIKAFNGLAKRSPMVAAIMTICMLSLAGIPPLAGFVGKFYLFSGAIQSGMIWLAFIGLIMSMVSVYYYLQVAKVMYIGSTDEVSPIKPGKTVGTALWVCLIGTILLGLYPAPLSNLAQVAIQIFL
ncbi:MAG TPA: NADH-quinone oxidoreductase subunit N [Syntrophomonadaceae bacterium]|nr:NADH-quinone oxidoreductase subunit N [Syntrophomonadaceae bacterium]